MNRLSFRRPVDELSGCHVVCREIRLIASTIAALVWSFLFSSEKNTSAAAAFVALCHRSVFRGIGGSLKFGTHDGASGSLLSNPDASCSKFSAFSCLHIDTVASQ